MKTEYTFLIFAFLFLFAAAWSVRKGRNVEAVIMAAFVVFCAAAILI